MKSEKYGTYYGNLINFKDNQDLILNDWDGYTLKEMNKLYAAGVKEILFDIEDNDTWTATMFFETDENTNFKELMKIIVGIIQMSLQKKLHTTLDCGLTKK